MKPLQPFVQKAGRILAQDFERRALRMVLVEVGKLVAFQSQDVAETLEQVVELLHRVAVLTGRPGAAPVDGVIDHQPFEVSPQLGEALHRRLDPEQRRALGRVLGTERQ